MREKKINEIILININFSVSLSLPQPLSQVPLDCLVAVCIDQ